jgi:hypothetical protein
MWFTADEEEVRRHLTTTLTMEAEMTAFRASAFLVVSVMCSGVAQAQCTFPFTNIIYGLWQANDGGLYHMRQIGGDVWWVGESTDGGQTFTNVFHGHIVGDKLTGGWLDVPHDMERRTNAGEVTMQINDLQSPTMLTKMNSPTGPAASVWKRKFVCHDTN